MYKVNYLLDYVILFLTSLYVTSYKLYTFLKNTWIYEIFLFRNKALTHICSFSTNRIVKSDIGSLFDASYLTNCGNKQTRVRSPSEVICPCVQGYVYLCIYVFIYLLVGLYILYHRKRDIILCCLVVFRAKSER